VGDGEDGVEAGCATPRSSAIRCAAEGAIAGAAAASGSAESGTSAKPARRRQLMR